MHKTYCQAAVPFFLILAFWYLFTQLHMWSAFVLPPPDLVGAAFREMLTNGELLNSLVVSLRRILTGFSLACALAFSLASFFLLFPRARSYSKGLLNFLRNVPPLTLIPLLILWFGIGETSKLLIIVLASFFPLLLNLESGFAHCDSKLLEVGQVLGFTHREILRKIILPQALPSIVTGMRIALGYSLRAIIGAEMIAASSGLGYLILDAQTMSRSDKVLVGIIVIGLLGMVLDLFFAKVIKVMFPYSKESAL